MDDPALQALLIPLHDGIVPCADALFLNARAPAGAWPGAQPPACVQTFKPWVDALRMHGDDVMMDIGADRRAALVMILPPRQRAWSRALLAQAVTVLVPGGTVLLAAANDEGAKSHEADLAKIANAKPGVMSKHKCRVAWARIDAPDMATAAAWSRGGEPQVRADGLWTQAGVFSADAIDPATQLLLRHLPSSLFGRVADLGAGAGVIARHVAAHCPKVHSLDLYEADARALAMARRNLEGVAPACAFHWHDVAAGIDARFDAILMNPPFHATGKAGLPRLGQRFIEVAADALAPHGRLWLVANAHLPYESVLERRFGDVQTVAQSRGYKVIVASGVRR